MRQVNKYSEKVTSAILAKALAPNAPSRVELAKECNIPYQTLYMWTTGMLKKKNSKEVDTPQRPQDKSAQDKLQAVIETMDKTETEKSAYCRQHGMYVNQLESWKKQILDSLGIVNAKQQKAEHLKTISEIKKLKNDLHRKDKALAEVSALLILKKKERI